jgi:hypothetical protein
LFVHIVDELIMRDIRCVDGVEKHYMLFVNNVIIIILVNILIVLTVELLILNKIYFENSDL